MAPYDCYWRQRVVTTECLHANGYKRVVTSEWLQPSGYNQMFVTQWLQADGSNRLITNDWLPGDGYRKVNIGPRALGAPRAVGEEEGRGRARLFC